VGKQKIKHAVAIGLPPGKPATTGDQRAAFRQLVQDRHPARQATEPGEESEYWDPAGAATPRPRAVDVDGQRLKSLKDTPLIPAARRGLKGGDLGAFVRRIGGPFWHQRSSQPLSGLFVIGMTFSATNFVLSG